MATKEETAAKVAAAQAALDDAQKEHAAAQEAAPEPRSPQSILSDILLFIAGRFGNHPDLEALIKEFTAATGVEVARGDAPQS